MNTLVAALALAALNQSAPVTPVLESAAANPAATAGPAIGAMLPAFELPDQSGARRRFDDLKGPEGLLLVFFRSADW
jgi:cytochrome oxidase Cu insertion factor (SCO1/SenC/PrrC family)